MKPPEGHCCGRLPIPGALADTLSVHPIQTIQGQLEVSRWPVMLVTVTTVCCGGALSN